MPLISIVIPVYNTGKDLITCLDSIARQTFSNFEVIVVDDGSSNGTELTCDQYADSDQRFHVYHFENAGVATARNRGIALAKGEWVTFIDSDDWIDAHYLQGMVDCILEKPNIDAVINSKIVIDEDQSFTFDKIEEDSFLSDHSISELLIREKMPTSMWCYMLKRIRLENIEVDPAIHYFEDLDFLLQFFYKPSACAINKQGGYHYRQGSITHRKLTKKTLTVFKMVDKQSRFISEELFHYLDGKMILDAAFVGTKDSEYHPDLARIIKNRAIAFCHRQMKPMHSKKIRLYLRLLALSPKLFYLLHRCKNF